MSISPSRHRIIYFVSALLFSLSINAQTMDTTRVLFVGNSFTYFFNVPQTVQAMADLQGIPMIVRQSTAGGATWEEHWNGEKDLTTHDKIKNGNWDIVILQNHSRSTIDHLDRFMNLGQQWDQVIKATGAQTVLYQTWGYKSNPLMISDIVKGYDQLAQRIKAPIVPIGELIDKARKARPDLNLFADDKHQSMNGSYLIALAFYKYLTQKSIDDIPARISSKDANGEKTYLMIIDANDAAFIKNLVSHQ